MFKNTRHLLFAGLYAGIILMLFLFFLPGLTARNWRFYLNFRIPVAAAIFLGAAAASVSTLILQTVAENRIITPGIMGLDSLFILIQTVLVFVCPPGSPPVTNAVLNFSIALSCMLLYSIILLKQLTENMHGLHTLLMIGIVVSTLFVSITNVIQKAFTPNEFAVVQNRLFASLNNASRDALVPGAILFPIILVILIKKRHTLDVLLLGQSQAVNLGITYRRELIIILSLTNGLVAVSTAVIGPFPFLGLIGVTIARNLCSGYKHGNFIHLSILLTDEDRTSHRSGRNRRGPGY